jgi:hypothetical protein
LRGGSSPAAATTPEQDPVTTSEPALAGIATPHDRRFLREPERHGTMRRSDESTDVRWVAPAELEELPIHHTTHLRHFLEQRDQPYVG